MYVGYVCCDATKQLLTTNSPHGFSRTRDRLRERRSGPSSVSSRQEGEEQLEIKLTV